MSNILSRLVLGQSNLSIQVYNRGNNICRLLDFSHCSSSATSLELEITDRANPDVQLRIENQATNIQMQAPQ